VLSWSFDNWVAAPTGNPVIVSGDERENRLTCPPA
jgi:hypothetical protein